MPFFVWTEKLETGIPKIDQQHRHLVDMINEIADASSDTNPDLKGAAVDKSISRLIDYTVYHFQTEEDLFKSSQYGDAEAHKKEHEKLRLSATDLYGRYAKGDDVSDELLVFLKKWLENHIIVSDMKYVETLKKHLKI
jgi:hemerythrin-like metal-binding protein